MHTSFHQKTSCRILDSSNRTMTTPTDLQYDQKKPLDEI